MSENESGPGNGPGSDGSSGTEAERVAEAMRQRLKEGGQGQPGGEALSESADTDGAGTGGILEDKDLGGGPGGAGGSSGSGG